MRCLNVRTNTTSSFSHLQQMSTDEGNDDYYSLIAIPSFISARRDQKLSTFAGEWMRTPIFGGGVDGQGHKEHDKRDVN
jgi:hypothetical protein